MKLTKEIPFLGCGIAYRREIAEDIAANFAMFDCVEIITEKYFGAIDELIRLQELNNKLVVIPHGVSMSIGSTYVDEYHLEEVKKVCDFLSAPYYTDHLCLTRTPGIDLGHLTPIPYTEEMLSIVINNVNLAQSYLQIPLLLENIAYSFDFPNNTIAQAEFFNILVAETNCGILLDVENLYINSINHKFSVENFLSAFPVDNVFQLHLAGGTYDSTKHFDTHNQLIHEPVWNLLDVILSKCKNIKAIIIEHDDNFPSDPFQLFNQVTRARQTLSRECSIR